MTQEQSGSWEEVATPTLCSEHPLSSGPLVTALVTESVTSVTVCLQGLFALLDCEPHSDLFSLCIGDAWHTWGTPHIFAGWVTKYLSARAFVPGPRVKYQNSPSSFFLSSTIFSLGLSSSHVLELKTEKKCFHEDCGGHARNSSVSVLFAEGLSFILIFMLPLQTTKSHILHYQSHV